MPVPKNGTKRPESSRAPFPSPIATPGPSPFIVSSVLSNFASVLRKDRRGREARAIESRISALRTALGPQLVVSVSDLLFATKDRP